MNIRFTVVWVPDEKLLGLEHALEINHIPSLEHFKPEEWGLPPYEAE
jgi:pseudouridine 5'-phosphatase